MLKNPNYYTTQFRNNSKLQYKKPSDGGTTGLDSLPSKGRGEPFERVNEI
jgi:hypothetical protein